MRTEKVHRRNRMQIGNFVVFPTLTVRDVWSGNSNRDLAEILRSFNLVDLLITLARINLCLQFSEDILESDGTLKCKFCSSYLRRKIKQRGLDKYIVFNRWSTLRLLSESVNVADQDQTSEPSPVDDLGNDLGQCYLIANGLSEVESVENGSEISDEQRGKTLVESIPAFEYGIYSAPGNLIQKSLIRSKNFFAHLQQPSANFDANETFKIATELTLQDYQHLIFGVYDEYRDILPQEVSKGTAPFFNTKPSPTLTPLYEKLLRHTCISLEELVQKSKETPSLPDEFSLWRKYPLVKLAKIRLFVSILVFSWINWKQECFGLFEIN